MGYFKVRPRGGLANDWNTANPILAEREIAFEYTGSLKKNRVNMKMGDGVTPWNNLPYAIADPVNINDKKQLIDTSGQACINNLEIIRTDTLTGKQLLANVVGGSSNSTFQDLANNAQNIKTQRDQYNSQIEMLNGEISNLNGQLINMTNDRNNWQNIANSRREERVVPFTTAEQTISITIPLNTTYIFEITEDDTFYAIGAIWHHPNNGTPGNVFDLTGIVKNYGTRDTSYDTVWEGQEYAVPFDESYVNITDVFVRKNGDVATIRFYKTSSYANRNFKLKYYPQ